MKIEHVNLIFFDTEIAQLSKIFPEVDKDGCYLHSSMPWLPMTSYVLMVPDVNTLRDSCIGIWLRSVSRMCS